MFKAEAIELEAVLWDLDGTMVDSVPLIRRSFRHAFAFCLKREISDEALNRHIVKPPQKVFAGLFQDLELGECPPDLMIQLMIELGGYQKRNIDQFVAFPGIVQCLTELKDRRFRNGVVTSRGNAQDILEYTGLAPFIDIGGVVVPDDTKEHKPDPAPVIKALERLQVLDAKRAILFGDADADIISGKAAGTVTGGVIYGITGPEMAKHKPDYLVTHPDQISAIVFNHSMS